MSDKLWNRVLDLEDDRRRDKNRITKKDFEEEILDITDDYDSGVEDWEDYVDRKYEDWLEEHEGLGNSCLLARIKSSREFQQILSMSKIKDRSTVPDYLKALMVRVPLDGWYEKNKNGEEENEYIWFGDRTNGFECTKYACLYQIGEFNFYFCFGRERGKSNRERPVNDAYQFRALILQLVDKWYGNYSYNKGDFENVFNVVNGDNVDNVIELLGLKELKNEGKDGGTEEKVASVNSAQVALFWFSKDYSGIEDIKGEVQVNWNDIDKNRTVLPNGTHRSYKGIKFRELPRGRVELNNGRFTITVGDQCPKEAVDLVILAFGLNSYKAYLDKIKYKSFWNSL